MTSYKKPWVRLPTQWIANEGLTQLSWKNGGHGSDNVAALMALTAIAHQADDATGVAEVTYDRLCIATGLSRAKVSKGLGVLERLDIIKRQQNCQSTYALTNYDLNNGWAKLPLRSMYSGQSIQAFNDFTLRRATELNALKLYFLFAARRDRKTNVANIGYDKIEGYTAIERGRIKSAISLLASLSLVYVEQLPSDTGVSNAYRIVGVDSYTHMGTRGRSLERVDYVVEE